MKCGLDSLPDELTRKLFDILTEEDRVILSLTCKRLRDFYKNNHLRVIHLQGHTKNLWVQGLKVLLNKKWQNDVVKISSFNLMEVVFQGSMLIQEKSLDSYIGTCCMNTVWLDFNEVNLTFEWLAYLRRLLPDLNRLTILRCSLSGDAVQISGLNQVNPIRKLEVSLPLMCNVDHGHAVSWLLDYCNHSQLDISFSLSDISGKRPVSKRLWSQDGHTKHARGQRPITHHISRQTWGIELARRPGIVYDRSILADYCIDEEVRQQATLVLNPRLTARARSNNAAH